MMHLTLICMSVMALQCAAFGDESFGDRAFEFASLSD